MSKSQTTVEPNESVKEEVKPVSRVDEALNEIRESQPSWDAGRQRFEEKLSDGDPALQDIRQIDALFAAKEITDAEHLMLHFRIRRRHRRFNVATRTRYNYHVMMDDFSEKWEEHANGQLVKGRDFLYKCGDWLVRVTSSGVYTILYAGQRAVLMGVKIIAAVGAAIWSSIQVVFDSMVELLQMAAEGVGKMVKPAVEGAKEAGSKLREVVTKGKDDKGTATVDGDVLTVDG